jgi:hypothetical protein
MTVSLPATPSPNSGVPLLRDFGGILTPFLGGPEQRINRVGTRFGVRITMGILPSDNAGRTFVSRLLQARQDRLLMKWPLGNFNPGATGSPLINANVASGSAIVIKGLPASYAAKEGQFISIIHSGRRYVHMFTGDGTANGSGVLTIQIFPMLRTAISTNDVVEIAQPMIEGNVLPGEELSWELSVEKNINLVFSVMEAA